MGLLRRISSGILAVFSLFVFTLNISWADVEMTGISVDTTGSGLSTVDSMVIDESTFTDDDPNDHHDQHFPVPGADDERADARGWLNEMSDLGMSGFYSLVLAWDGEGEAGAQGAISSSHEQADGDTITTEVDGKISAVAARENGIQQDIGQTGAFSKLWAVGGNGEVDTRDFYTNQEFVLALSQARTWSIGNPQDDPATAADESQPAVAHAEGDASVQYTQNGTNSTAGVTDTEADSTSNMTNYHPDNDWDDMTKERAYVISVAGWENGPAGVTMAGFAGVNAETRAQRFGGLLGSTDEDRIGPAPESSAEVGGSASLSLNVAPLFSINGKAGGFAESVSDIDSGIGEIESTAGKNAFGQTGTATDSTPIALAWIAGTVGVDAAAQGRGYAHAVNPAVLTDQSSDPDPSMTVTSTTGTYSAAMGSSSLANAEVTAEVIVDNSDPDDPFGGAYGETITSAFSFARAAQNDDFSASETDWDDPVNGPTHGDIDIFDAGGESAIVGFGGIIGVDSVENPGDDIQTTTAQTANLFGAAASPNFFGGLSNGSSDNSIIYNEETDDFVMIGPYVTGTEAIRSNSASADELTGTNYANAIAFNELLGILDTTDNAPWLGMFQNYVLDGPDDPYTHVSVGTMTAGGQ